MGVFELGNPKGRAGSSSFGNSGGSCGGGGGVKKPCPPPGGRGGFFLEEPICMKCPHISSVEGDPFFNSQRA